MSVCLGADQTDGFLHGLLATGLHLHVLGKGQEGRENEFVYVFVCGSCQTGRRRGAVGRQQAPPYMLACAHLHNHSTHGHQARGHTRACGPTFAFARKLLSMAGVSFALLALLRCRR